MKQPHRFRAPNNGALALAPDALASFFDEVRAEAVTVTRGGVAIVSVEGPLFHKSSWWSDSYEAIRGRVEDALADPDVRSVLLKLDSPGGEAAGCFETVRAIRASAAAAGKQIVAFVDEHAYSAAYALACSADKIVMPESGGVGSIGCLQVLVDATKMDEDAGLAFHFVASGSKKADGNAHAGITKDVLASAQDRVDSLAAMFFDLVAEARGVTAESVRSLEAGCFYGSGALDIGLVDGLMSLETAIEMLEGASSSEETKGTTNMKTKKATRLVKSTTNPLAVKAAAEEKDPKKKEETAEEEEKEETAETEDEEETAETEDEEETAESDADETDAEEEDEEETASAIGAADILATVAHITGKSDPAEQLGALHALASNASNGSRVSATARREKIAAEVEAGVRAGKIVPAQREYWTKIASRPDGLKSLRGFLAKAPQIAPLAEGGSRMPAPGAGQFASHDDAMTESTGSDTALTAADLEVCKQMRISPDEMRKLRASRPARFATTNPNPLRVVNGGK